jgi:hypothetical protein
MGLTAALDQGQHSFRNQAAYRYPCRPFGHACAARQPANRETDSMLSFESAMPQKMRIHSAVNYGKAKLWRQQVFHLLPDEFGVWFLVH